MCDFSFRRFLQLYKFLALLSVCPPLALRRHHCNFHFFFSLQVADDAQNEEADQRLFESLTPPLLAIKSVLPFYVATVQHLFKSILRKAESWKIVIKYDLASTENDRRN